jgi:hypothetical protein
MIRRWYYIFRIGLAHAAYHRHLNKLTQHREKRDLINFKKRVYQVEDAWRKIVYYKQQLK